MISNIFYFLADLHSMTGWDPAVGETFGEIAKWLEGHSL